MPHKMGNITMSPLVNLISSPTSHLTCNIDESPDGNDQNDFLPTFDEQLVTQSYDQGDANLDIQIDPEEKIPFMILTTT